ncbi:hypothetical protein IV203_022614 [Nitzschia inconspicua]|uniref:Uncharacterized protein n=1 Tax=Nitzschia inconspicua TaxID=303405 RepID=A0A9K3PF65_9STRA|nr:hypothetical protein IV203_022614 [Nitzschia inconspicua]
MLSHFTDLPQFSYFTLAVHKSIKKVSKLQDRNTGMEKMYNSVQSRNYIGMRLEQGSWLPSITGYQTEQTAKQAPEPLDNVSSGDIPSKTFPTLTMQP